MSNIILLIHSVHILARQWYHRNMPNSLDSTIDQIVDAHPAGRGRKPIMPSAKVTRRYDNGQPAEYEVEGRALTRRQYHVLVQSLQEQGTLPPRKPGPLRKANA